ncbi:MAG: ice-binding family protein [Armatimonadota bacterium]
MFNTTGPDERFNDGTRTRRRILPLGAAIGAATLVFAGSPDRAQAADFLGSASSFAVLAGSTVTNKGTTLLTGDLGVSPGTALTDFSDTSVTGSTHAGDAVAAQAQVDLTTAYTTLAGLTPSTNLSGINLGGLTLTAGVYRFNSSAQLTGGLILDAQNNPNALFVFQIGETLTTASLSSVTFINGGAADNLYWQVGSSATLGTNTAFRGSIVALTSITLTTGATIEDGRALARNAAVTLDTNRITVPLAATATVAPEPGSLALVLPVLGAVGMVLRRRRTYAA